MAIYNTIPAPINEEDALLETTSSKPKSLKRIVAGAAVVRLCALREFYGALPVFEGDEAGADWWAFGDDVKGENLAEYKQMMAVCDHFLDGSMIGRCKVQAGFQAVVGVGSDIDQDGPEGYPHCSITAPPRQAAGPSGRVRRHQGCQV